MTTISAKHIAIAIASCLIASCSSDSDDTPDTEQTTFQEGQFIDSPVAGLTYETSTSTGITDTNGFFNYSTGETIQFSIGELEFPSVNAADIITPIELAVGAANPEALGTNIAMLLQSLDEDGDSSNGINIFADASLAAAPIDFDVSVEEFMANPDVINLVANSGSVTTTLISPEAASAHLLATLADLNGQGTGEPEEGIAGYWAVEGAGDYVLIEQSGDITFYDLQISDECYNLRTGAVTQVEGSLYNVITDDGESQQLIITRDVDTLNILLVGTLNLVIDSSSADLPLCS